MASLLSCFFFFCAIKWNQRDKSRVLRDKARTSPVEKKETDQEK